jgi:hypothetical protein
MNTVRSISGLRDDLVKLLSQPAPAVATAAAEGFTLVAPEAAAASRGPVAVVGVHGISPLQQYAFQDQLAIGLLGYLNAVEAVAGSGVEWIATPHWPHVAAGTQDAELKPSALRLHRRDEPDPERPTSRVYDVYEGYWSPFSKDKANIASLLSWLLGCTFLATSSTARIPGNWRKLAWDVGYVLSALAIGLACVAVAAVAANGAWGKLLTLFPPDSPTKPPPTFFQFAFDPLHQLGALPRDAWIQLGVDVVLAYLLAQLLTLAMTRLTTARRTAELRRDARAGGTFAGETIAASTFHLVATLFFVGAFVVLGALDGWWLSAHHASDAWQIASHAAGVVAAVFFFERARALADFVVLDVLGDIQVYTTHDSNAAFFAIREQIIAAVTDAVRGPLAAVDPTPPSDPAAQRAPLYERVHVAGHSLGSTVGLDVLIRLRQLVEEGILEPQGWNRLRSFTTFGTALEKTRFFFDVRNPTVSAAQQQFQNDVYGKYFTLERTRLAEPDNANGIYWANYWYARDIVANPIVSYESQVAPGKAFSTWVKAPGAQPICDDHLLPHDKPPWAFVHGDYVSDALFWTEAGPIFTS